MGNGTTLIDFNGILGYNPFIVDKNSRAGRLGKRDMLSLNFYIDILSLLSQIAYKWYKIPIEIPNFQMEKCLFYVGCAGMTFDDVIEKYILLPATKSGAKGGLNIYGEPYEYRLFSYSNSYNKYVKDTEDGVVCYNNAIKTSNMYMVRRYAERLQMIDEVIDMNMKQQKTPYLIICDEKTKLTLKNILNNIQMGEEAVYSTKNLDLENVLKTLDLNVELKASDLINAKREIFNEACMMLGISANTSNKKERLISSEVQNDERKNDIFREIGLSPRKYFCDKANKLYNLDIDVEYVLDEKDNQLMEDIINNTDKNKRIDLQDKANKNIKDKE